MPPYRTLALTSEFLDSLISDAFSAGDRRRFVRALRLLDENERHPSLRVHALRGDREGQWSASASDQLRITFRRLPNGLKELLECSRHYGD
jgi:plasmid maintenance system killer protein